MARPQYKITDADYPAAFAYVKRKMFEDAYELIRSQYDSEQQKNTTVARDEFQIILEANELAAEPLTAWCEKWLGKKEWTALKAAIRSSRRYKKAADADQQVKMVSLTPQAWRILHELSKRDNITLSEFIVKRQEKEWLDK